MTQIIPIATKLAAKRGFIRTAAQSLASVIPTSGIVIAVTGEWLLGVGLGTAGAVVSAALAGAVSYLSILSSGIPDEYVDGWISEQGADGFELADDDDDDDEL